MTDDQIVLRVAAGALRTGVDPSLVADFLDRVLEIETPTSTIVRTASEQFFAELERAEAMRRHP
jgi:hypothetical protein